jgi:hypothetical protein
MLVSTYKSTRRHNPEEQHRNIEMDVREIAFGVWLGFTWLRIGTGGGLL